jgi:anti-sigma regulatory factor (Ser/Thr protein kinase)
VIAACEACANAIEHAYGGARPGTVRLRLEIGGADLVITVTDHGRWRPPQPVPDRGHGLRLIRATMREVAITTGETGTTVVTRASVP